MNKPTYKIEDNKLEAYKIELWFVPLLIIIPLVVSFYLGIDWYNRGFSQGISTYDGEVVIASIIFIGNIIFDIPFLKSFLTNKK